MLAAAGIGAILSPPTLGAAAFIIAEFLEISYLQVLVYAVVPTFLYYLGILLAIEADTRRFEVKGLELETPGFWRLLARWGYHFSSLFLIVILLALNFSPFRAVRVRDRAGVPALVPRQARPDGASQGLRRAGGRGARRAADRGHHARRRASSSRSSRSPGSASSCRR